MRSAQILNILARPGVRRLLAVVFVLLVLGVLPIWTVSEQTLVGDISDPALAACKSRRDDIDSIRRMAADTNAADRAADGWESGLFLRSGTSGVWRLYTGVRADLTLGPIRWNKRYCIVSADGPLARR